MKAISFLIVGLISAITVFAQQPCKGDIIEKENIELAKNIFKTEIVNEKVNGNSYVGKLSTMSDEKFNALCERFEYNPNFEKAKKINPNLSSYVMYAENITGSTNLFCVVLNNMNKKETANLPPEAQKRLQVIDNTIEMYKNIQEALDKETQNNKGEIIDNGTHLIIKNVPFVSLPQIGKILGQTAANVNIYFRKNEFKNLIAILERDKQYILNPNKVREDCEKEVSATLDLVAAYAAFQGGGEVDWWNSIVSDLAGKIACQPKSNNSVSNNEKTGK